jgi:Sigma-70, region 4
MGGRMTPLESLAPDQRAVVSLVLQQGRSYDEIAAVLGIPAEAVRERAHAGLTALAPDDAFPGDGLPAAMTAPIADYLLGQQPVAEADATRGLLAQSAPARTWATGVAARLGDVAREPLPEIPAPAAGPEPDEPAVDGGTPDAPDVGASRLGGALLIAAVVAVVAVVLFLVLRGGDDTGGEPAATTAARATATPTQSAAADLQVADTIALRPAAGGSARGTMTVYLQGKDQMLFELVAENVPRSAGRAAYAVWLTGPGSRTRRLGFADAVGADGTLGIQGPTERDVGRFPRLYATYENVVVSEESTESARRPSKVILTGSLPSGR